MSLTLILNGQPRVFETLPDSATLENLVQEIGLKGDRVAIEYNGEIASRTTWDSITLSDNDRLEIVHFVGGGTV
ncbi:sulfur carrier protein ThiS [Edaphobacter sp. HDX4]|uniref:sulfur carrier protein ThiS n=1 Tax=Edaphobacter sp. HDX4 TaxID=2794064 RepID=UPI002FE63AE9